jgi:pimeloyl-ACP methyl ester carboxylesterase
MALHEPFDLPVRDGYVTGVVHAPTGDGPHAAVLFCCDLPGSMNDPAGTTDALTRELNAVSITTVEFVPRAATSEADAPSVVDDAAAVFRWMLMREDVDAGMVSVFGCGLGAIVAAGLAARTDQIARLCLLGPVTAADAATRLDKPNGAPALLDAGAMNDAFRASLANLPAPEDAAVHDRPTLVVCGAADRVAPAVGRQAYLDALERAGRAPEHVLVALSDHLCSSEAALTTCVARIVGFMTRMAEPARASVSP